MSVRSVAPDYFDRMYATDPDPWRYTTSRYELRKYAATLSALPRARFGSVFEMGCSIGVLTRMLASRCRFLLGVDTSEIALQSARSRCRDMRAIRLQRMRLPREWPSQTFDLILLSEVLYFQSWSDGRTTARKTLRHLRANGVVVLVNWLGETGTARSGEIAAEQFIQQTRRSLHVVHHRRTACYRLDVLSRQGNLRSAISRLSP
jgi:SAM-dependent methyltransferase